MQFLHLHAEAPGTKIAAQVLISLKQAIDMGTHQAPTKEQVRQYLQRRFGSNGPVPSPTEIRHALGWGECPRADDVDVPCEDTVSHREDSAA